MHTSFLVYRNYYYLKASLWLSGLGLLAYWLDPARIPNGGTWAGYGLGGVATALIVWSLWLGVRKRRYHSRLGSVQGWVSAHVYLGIALILLVLLHSGFQFGWNVHSLSFFLLLAVIASGGFGVYAYVRYPHRLALARGGLSPEALARERQELHDESRERATGLPAPLRQAVDAALREDAFDSATRALTEAMSTSDAMEECRRLLELLGRLKVVSERIEQARRLESRMHGWLLWHIPLSLALLAALIVHIFTVFLYW